ncbi:ATP-dependent carboxylate-amine ligase, partial [Micromonospora fluostatini]
MLADITHVYFRRPGPFDLPAEMDPLERRWAEQEARLGLGGLLFALPHARWVNDPHAMTAAEFKPRQLAVAARLGMTVPPTVITNDPQRAREFAGVHADAGVIYKPLHTHSYI